MSNCYLAAMRLSYILPNGNPLFENLNFSLKSGEKVALIGDNGCGKSTLLKIICGNLTPSAGTIEKQAKIFLVPQDVNLIKGKVDEILGWAPKLSSLKRLEKGMADADDFEIIGNDWDFAEKITSTLQSWGIKPSLLEREFSDLSGGEKEKLLICRALLSGAEFLLLDEPTNNLDLKSKEQLWKKLSQLRQGVLLVTHDRFILEHITPIWEMSSSGLKCFGGNYEFYLREKERIRQALQSKAVLAEKEAAIAEEQLLKSEQKRARQNRYGEKQIKNNKFASLQKNTMKDKADNTSLRAKKHLVALIEEKNSENYNLRLTLKEEKIKIPLPNKPFIREKLLVIDNLSFGFSQEPLLSNLSLIMKGNDRLAVCGNNGCGKSTLLKLIIGELAPQQGTLKLNGRAVYLNQNLDWLNKEQSIAENILCLNPGVTINQVYRTLANFKFRNTAAEKKVKILSGGELLRATLAALFCTASQPELLILDEPTNNLDLSSQEILEEALAQFQGALLVVAHDPSFLQNIKIRKKFSLPEHCISLFDDYLEFD